MDTSIRKLQQQYAEAFAKALMSKMNDDLLAVVLYGSVARGTSHPESDIDLLIVWRNAPSTYYERLMLMLEVVESIQPRPEAIALHEKAAYARLGFLVLSEEEAHQNRHIYLDMTHEAIILCERDDFFTQLLDQMRDRLTELGSQRIWLPDGTWYWDLKPDLVAGEIFQL